MKVVHTESNLVGQNNPSFTVSQYSTTLLAIAIAFSLFIPPEYCRRDTHIVLKEKKKSRKRSGSWDDREASNIGIENEMSGNLKK